MQIPKLSPKREKYNGAQHRDNRAWARVADAAKKSNITVALSTERVVDGRII